MPKRLTMAERLHQWQQANSGDLAGIIVRDAINDKWTTRTSRQTEHEASTFDSFEEALNHLNSLEVKYMEIYR